MTSKTYSSIPVTLEEGQRYKWCQCGFSQNMPWCDHSHREHSDKKSLKFVAEQTETVHLCCCAETSTPPYCDNHKQCKQG